jgi:hypothetical protein
VLQNFRTVLVAPCNTVPIQRRQSEPGFGWQTFLSVSGSAARCVPSGQLKPIGETNMPPIGRLSMPKFGVGSEYCLSMASPSSVRQLRESRTSGALRPRCVRGPSLHPRPARCATPLHPRNLVLDRWGECGCHSGGIGGC